MTPKQALKIAIEDVTERMKDFAFNANVSMLDKQASPAMKKAEEKYKARAQALEILKGMLKQRQLL